MMTASPYENIYPKNSEGCSLFSKCCFCIPLKTGCFILGYISLGLNFVITLFFIGTLIFLGSYTHGFRYVRLKPDEHGVMVPDLDSMDQSRINITITILVLIGFLNVAWLLMNVVLLIGLHMRRPGHIKLHVSVAVIRLLLSITGVSVYGRHHTSQSMFICCAEIALSAYFIFMYYKYAIQLEEAQKPPETREISDIVADVLFNYPQNIDRITLTEKNDKSFAA